MSTLRAVRAVGPRLTAAALLLASGSGALAIVSNNANTGANFDGIHINAFLGATTFYGLGYTGSRAVIGNIEAGHIWGGHESLAHVTTFLNAAPVGQLGQTDRHATWVGQAIAGRKLGGDAPGSLGERVRQGIAHGSTLWSGAIASQWTGAPFTLSFNWANSGIFRSPYDTMMTTGVAGRTADVINGSWGATVPTGFTYAGVYTDHLANQTGKTLVFAAMNNGAVNTVGAPGSAWNNITVGSLGADTDANPYNVRSGFSSFGPCDYYNPNTGLIVPGVRAAVDISAPGQNLDLALYGGATGGNTGGVNNPGNTLYSLEVSGTSFAAPIVAGGAGLLVDVAYDKYAANANSRDGRVIKAVLLNSATKTGGWNNGQALVGATVQTTQSLDWQVGAGRMNLTQAYTQFTAGTTDIPGNAGGLVNPIGWDYGMVTQGAATDYTINQQLVGGSLFTVTLDWFMDNSYNAGNDTASIVSLDDLDLEVWQLVAGVPTNLVGRSFSTYNNVEHLHFQIPNTGEYMVRVLWAGELFDFAGDANSEFYALAWNGVAVPAPAGVMVMLLGGAAVIRRRRR